MPRPLGGDLYSLAHSDRVLLAIKIFEIWRDVCRRLSWSFDAGPSILFEFAAFTVS